MRAMRRSPHHGHPHKLDVRGLVLQPALDERLEGGAVRAAEPEHFHDFDFSGTHGRRLSRHERIVVHARLPLADRQLSVRRHLRQSLQPGVAASGARIIFRLVAFFLGSGRLLGLCLLSRRVSRRRRRSFLLNHRRRLRLRRGLGHRVILRGAPAGAHDQRQKRSQSDRSKHRNFLKVSADEWPACRQRSPWTYDATAAMSSGVNRLAIVSIMAPLRLGAAGFFAPDNVRRWRSRSTA